MELILGFTVVILYLFLVLVAIKLLKYKRVLKDKNLKIKTLAENGDSWKQLCISLLDKNNELEQQLKNKKVSAQDTVIQQREIALQEKRLNNNLDFDLPM